MGKAPDLETMLAKAAHCSNLAAVAAKASEAYPGYSFNAMVALRAANVWVERIEARVALERLGG